MINLNIDAISLILLNTSPGRSSDLYKFIYDVIRDSEFSMNWFTAIFGTEPNIKQAYSSPSLSMTSLTGRVDMLYIFRVIYAYGSAVNFS